MLFKVAVIHTEALAELNEHSKWTLSVDSKLKIVCSLKGHTSSLYMDMLIFRFQNSYESL